MNEPVFYMSMQYRCQDAECGLELTFLLEDGCEGPKEQQKAPDKRLQRAYGGGPLPDLIDYTNTERFILPVPFVAGTCPRCGGGHLQHSEWHKDKILDSVIVGVPDSPHFRYPDNPYAEQACGHPVLAGLPDYAEYAPTDHTPDLRCVSCNHTVNSRVAGRAGYRACPECGSTDNPVLIAEDVTLVLNWMDLRCLVEWAGHYIENLPERQETTQYWEGLKKRINAHRPEGAAPLTLLEEIDGLRDAGYNVTLVQPDPPKAGDGV